MRYPAFIKGALALLACYGLIPMLIAAAPVSSGDGSPSFGEKDAHHYKLLLEHGVSKTTAVTLIEKLNEGEIWDSMRNDSSPVSESSSIDGITRVTRSVYKDGSIAISRIDDPALAKQRGAENGISSRGVTNCEYSKAGSYGGYWKHCQVYRNFVVAGHGFYFDYENIKGSPAKITQYGNPIYNTVQGSWTGGSFRRMGPDRVRLISTHTVANKQSTLWVQANVKGPNAWETHG